MPKRRLTEEGVKRVDPPAAGKTVYYDDIMPGLLFIVNAGGSKSWAAQTYRKTTAKSGKQAGQVVTVQTTRKLGRYPHLKLAEAREKARVFLADPAKALAHGGSSFEDIANSYLARHVIANGLRTRTEIERCLNKYVLPQWRHRAFVSITRADVAKLIDEVVKDHGKRQADIVLGMLRALMNWYQARDGNYVNPIVRGMLRRQPGEGRRSHTLDDDELAALWSVAPTLGGFGAMCLVLLLTAQRFGKVVSMEWSDVVDGVWTVKTAAREKGNAGELVLPPMVGKIVDAQPRIHGEARVFVGCDAARWKAEMDRRLTAALGRPVKHWVLHDLRRTARSLMSRAGVRPDIAERVLGHRVGSAVEQTYDRHRYVTEMAQALKALAKLVGGIVGEAPRKAVGALRRRGGSR
jgi:integrase